MKKHQNGHLGYKSNGDVKDKAGIDVQSVVSMEILECENNLVETHNEEVLRRVAEMQELVENSEQYLNKHQRESSDSDGSHISSDGSVSLPPPPANLGQLKHSDSLLLLAQVCYIFLIKSHLYENLNYHTLIEGYRGQYNCSGTSIELG